jgi:hypothetical protein
MPTILDWHNILIPNSLTGKSLLPYLGEYYMFAKSQDIQYDIIRFNVYVLNKTNCFA